MPPFSQRYTALNAHHNVIKRADVDQDQCVLSKRSINPVLVDGVCFQEAKGEAGEQFQGSSAS